MKIIIQLASILFVLLFFITCKKEIRHTFVEGIAQDYYTKQPIADAMVQLKGPGGDEYNTITTVYTDASGHFEFEKFRAEKSGDYSINIDGKGYNSQPKFGQHKIEKGKKNILIPTIVKACYIKFKFNNILGIYNDSDKVCIKIDISEEKIIQTGDNKYHCQYGNSINYDAVFISKGLNLPFSWTIRKNNIEDEFSNKIKVNNDTTIIINY
jgi:hypothetical protein